MSTLPIIDTIVSVSRLKPDADNSNKESYVVDLSMQSVKMNIQPASNEDTVMIEGVFAETDIAFTTNSGFKSGDRVTVSGTNQKLAVKGIKDWSQDPIPHYQILLIKPEGYNS